MATAGLAVSVSVAYPPLARASASPHAAGSIVVGLSRSRPPPPPPAQAAAAGTGWSRRTRWHRRRWVRGPGRRWLRRRLPRSAMCWRSPAPTSSSPSPPRRSPPVILPRVSRVRRHMSSSSPAWDVDGSGSSSSTTFTTTLAAGWHVLEVHYSRSSQSRGSTFEVGGHRCSITYVPDDGLSVDDDAVWICFKLQFSHSAASGGRGGGGGGMVRSKYSLLDQAGEAASCYLNDDERICIKREEFEPSYVKDDGRFCIRCDVTVLGVSTQALATVLPPPDMGRHIGELLTGGVVGADVTLEVGGEAFHAHKIVLAARSSVLRAVFFGGSVTKGNAAAAAARRVMRIDGIEPEVFKAMLQFIYTDTLPPEIERGNRRVVMAWHLLVAADRYGLERLKSMCEHICSAAIVLANN